MQFNFSESLFKSKGFDPAAKYIFVADLFADDYIGGAELTSEALIGAAPDKIEKLKCSQLNTDLSLLESGKDKIWIFGNYSSLNAKTIGAIARSRLKYAICEYDYKFCKFRLPEKHEAEIGTPCDCIQSQHGQLIQSFMANARHIFWMSQQQAEKNLSFMPALRSAKQSVLSSVFDPAFFSKIEELLCSIQERERKNWIVLGSNSWVKGADAAKKYCEDLGLDYEVVWNLPYDELLKKLVQSVGLVYLPAGSDTCPRLVIEAKLLHCELVINENVQHAKEAWFSGPREQMIGYLKSATGRFWRTIGSIEKSMKISGYTTTYNCFDQKYPFKESIDSMLNFCDEVCVVDGGSSDRTWSSLQQMALGYMAPDPATGETIQRLKIKQIPRDWTHKRHAVFDGQQKAEARRMCSGDFCWQQDSDEIVSASDSKKIVEIADKMPSTFDLLSLPVIEFWGGPKKVRVDVNPWKWRLSRNLPYITHGIPTSLRKYDSEGNLFAVQGTDGCDYINTQSGDPIPHASFYGPEADAMRRAALSGDEVARIAYQNWMSKVSSALPVVFHFSWWDLERKIRTYKNYWTKHWESLFDIKVADTAENNFMFDKPWSEVTDDDIRTRAVELQKIGGFIWHKKWKGEMTPWIETDREVPNVM